MKKKCFLFALIIIIGFSISSCSNQESTPIEFFGEFSYGECVYINPLSSATLDYMTEKNEGLGLIEIEAELFQITFQDEELSHLQTPIYTETEIDLYINNGFNINIQSFLSTVIKRTDIYIGDEYQGYSLFTNTDTIYLAQIKYLGENNDWAVWSIYQLQ